MRESGEAWAASLEKLGYYKAGSKILDLGCGDGNTAFPFAQRGAHVTGIDISSPLVAAANKRKEQFPNLNIQFQEGDACNLAGVPDNSFDLVVSIFGVRWSPNIDSGHFSDAVHLGHVCSKAFRCCEGARPCC